MRETEATAGNQGDASGVAGRRPDRLTILLAGDVMTGRGIDQVLATPSAPGLHEPWVRDARDYVQLAEGVNGAIGRRLPGAAIWGEALAQMERLGADLRIVNLETAVTTADEPWPGKGIHYRMHPANVDVLTAAGLHGCVLANNHVLDWGRAGLDETLRVLHAAGVQTAGAGSNLEAAWAPATLLPAHGPPVRVYSFATATSGVPAGWAAAARRSGVALLPDLSEATARQVADATARHLDGRSRTVVSIHWGDNWVERVPDEHRRFAHRLIDLGAADVVHGHSSHHPLPMEVHRGRLILYGCGDLVNDYEGITPRGDRRSDVGCLYAVRLDPADGRLLGLEIVPMQLRRFRLGAADAAAREYALRQFHAHGAALGTAVVVGDDGRWTLRWQEVAAPSR